MNCVPTETQSRDSISGESLSPSIPCDLSNDVPRDVARDSAKETSPELSESAPDIKPWYTPICDVFYSSDF